ncbi:hypothetical protein [uncultured Mediterranean phage uvMED]|nr:hypothetical protein [uncultured Mediterranean phage uvMED]
MKKMTVTLDNTNGIIEDMTSEEVSEIETIKANNEAVETAQAEAKEANDNLKASAKAKLIAGEALTEDEANTIVL